MKITNTFNLPAALYEAICRDEYSKSGTYSASELPQPPQVTILKKRHYHEMVKDASEMLWLFLGKAVHYYLAAHDTHNSFKEESLIAEIAGVTVSGTSDIYDGDVRDYKVTSVWALVGKGLKTEWEAQLNIYDWLWFKNGFAPKELFIDPILRDWHRSKTFEKDYPKIAFQTLGVPKWGVDKTELYLHERIGLYLPAEALPDDAMPPCSLSDQWARPAVYAVRKEGRKTAVRLYAGQEEAETHAKEVKGYVEHRPGKKVRCIDYCDARPWCRQYRDEHPAETAADFGFEVEG